jgi:two-component system LytT family response regulator
MALRVVIADDEEAGRRRLSDLVRGDDSLELLAECKSGMEAVQAVIDLQPDLVLLDVQMPHIGGFDVIEAVGPEYMPAVVFVTAYDQFAVQAFEAHALDYLLKPFSDARFLVAISRARQRILERTTHDIHGLSDAVKRKFPDRLVVRKGNRCVIVEAEDVDWIEACDNYVRLHVGAQQLMMRGSVTSLAERLSPDQFMRIHRSTIVNIKRISRVEPHNQTEFGITLGSGVRLTSSRAYRDTVRAFLHRA